MKPFGSPLFLYIFAFCSSLVLPSHCFQIEEMDALWAFKQAIYNDPLPAIADWNKNDKDPCAWTGISCSESRDHVVAINLSNKSLKGFLAPELGLLKSLQQLILHNNLFLGTLPKQLGMLKSLTLLDLSTNRFTGPVPPEFGGLEMISQIKLSSNGLTGSLPPELGNLPRLMELRLDRNRFLGAIPGSGNSATNHDMSGLCLLQQLKFGDFSFNFFTGKIPFCFVHLPRTSFQGNCFYDRKSLNPRTPALCDDFRVGVSSETSDSANGRAQTHFKHKKFQEPTWLIILEIIVGVVMLFTLITTLINAARKCTLKSSVINPWKRNSSSSDQTAISIDGEMLKHVSSWSRQELEVACEDFSNIIGSSSDSVVYKGTIKDGSEIAVISLCISEDHWTSYLELYFQTEVANLARLDHENLAKLLGYCAESNPFSRMLVFDYASNGTLYEHLHYGEGFQLSWSRRMKISLGIARGLRYMHTELQPPFSLSDLHSSTVYLTEDFSPKLVDFESWKAVLTRLENSGYITNGSASHGLRNSLEQRDMDIQGNIFSFGVLLLEIISGRPPFCKDRGCLVDWATEYLDKADMMCYLVDPELRYFNHDDLGVICSVVGLCVQSEPFKRPSMQVLAAMLEKGIDTSASANLKESPLAWAELVLSS